MAKAKTSDEFRHVSLQDRQSIVRYLEAVGQGLGTGMLYFASGKSELLLRPDGMLRFVVQAKRKGDQVKLQLKISWREDQTQTEAAGLPLMIRSDEDDDDEEEELDE
jgi:amphi-Trp domain-containing protein